MPSIWLHKAQATGNMIPVPSAEIVIDKPFPNSNDLETADAMMHGEAMTLVRTLRNSLPQGTWARFVALVAREWADDQHGILSATQWNHR